MLPLYVGALALGGVLIAVSIFFGGEADKDAGVEGDHEVDHDAEVEGEVHAEGGHDLGGLDKAVDGETAAWMPFLSMRFWTFALAAFGLSGVLLRLFSFGDLGSGLVAVPLGVAVGWGAAYAFRLLKKSDVSGDTGLRSIQGAEATVLLPIGPGRRGKVRALVDGQAVDLLAATGDDRTLPRGEKVLVVSVSDGLAQVTAVRLLPATPEGVEQ